MDYADDRLGGDTMIDWDTGPGYQAQGGDSGYIAGQFFQSYPYITNKIHTGPVCRNSTDGAFTTGCATQSLPDFDNPCNRIWNRYFSNNASITTWFNSNSSEYQHSLSYDIFWQDCNDTVTKWREGVHQIR